MRYSLFRGVGTSTRDLEYVLSSVVLTMSLLNRLHIIRAIAAGGVELQRVLEGLESTKSRLQQIVREIERKITEEEVTDFDPKFM
jgi:hypothetical protein